MNASEMKRATVDPQKALELRIAKFVETRSKDMIVKMQQRAYHGFEEYHDDYDYRGPSTSENSLYLVEIITKFKQLGYETKVTNNGSFLTVSWKNA